MNIKSIPMTWTISLKSASNAFMNLIKHALLQNTVEIPSFVQPYILDQLCNIISCAIKAVEMMPDRDYVVHNGNVFPVDYQNSGAIEFDRKLEGTPATNATNETQACNHSFDCCNKFQSM